MVVKAHGCISSVFGVGITLFCFFFSLFLGGSYGSVTKDKSCGLEASLTQLARKQRTRGVLKASTVGLVVAPDVSSGEPLRVSATGLTISPNLSSGAL